jgi:hypothetical protein
MRLAGFQFWSSERNVTSCEILRWSDTVRESVVSSGLSRKEILYSVRIRSSSPKCSYKRLGSNRRHDCLWRLLHQNITLSGWGSFPGRGEMCVYSTASSSALGPTQPPVHCVSGTFPPGDKAAEA